MADALCGPSNPLQSFQKHTSTDRSLQQDRLISRGVQHQGFRSENRVTAGILDSEFEAFEAGASAGHFEQPPFSPQAQYPVHANAGLSNWASDFQRLNVQNQQPPQLQRPPPLASWHQDFLQQNQSSPTRRVYDFQNALPSQSDNISNYQSPSSSYNFTSRPLFEQSHGSSLQPFANSQQSSIPHLPPEQEIDPDAFEREFEARTVELFREEEQQRQTSTELGQDVLVDGARTEQRHDLADHMQEQVDEIHRQAEQVYRLALNEEDRESMQPEDIERHPLEQEHEPDLDRTPNDDLARTAGELLERVSGETSPKFQNSTFLSLMTQLRDGDVRVEGNEMFEVDQATGATRTIPSEEQDEDRGRNASMSGALRSSSVGRLQTIRRDQRRSEKPRRRQVAFDDNSLYGGHLVDDF